MELIILGSYIGFPERSFAPPKSEGGLGFRNMHAFNLRLLAKQGWRLLTNPSSLVAQTLEAKYYPSGSFLNAKVRLTASLCRKNICAAKDLLNEVPSGKLDWGICKNLGGPLATSPHSILTVLTKPPHVISTM